MTRRTRRAGRQVQIPFGRLLPDWMLRMTLLLATVYGKRGPHHPQSPVALQHKRNEIDAHLAHETEHIKEDLEQWLGKSKDPAEMTEDEKNFYFFKIHDSDNNNLLDGLEMMHAATHRSKGTFHRHRQHHNSDSNVDSAGNAQEPIPNDRTFDNELNHIIDVIDDFFGYADLNDDGLLNFAEYVHVVSEPLPGIDDNVTDNGDDNGVDNGDNHNDLGTE